MSPFDSIPTPEMLKQAFKAFKKRLPVTQLDSDSQCCATVRRWSGVQYADRRHDAAGAVPQGSVGRTGQARRSSNTSGTACMKSATW